MNGVLSLGTVVTDRLPWASPVWGGIALLLWVAVPNAVLCVLALRGSRATALASLAVGTLLVAWILVQLAFIRDLTFFHPLYIGIGLVLIGLGARLLTITDGMPSRSLLAETDAVTPARPPRP